MHIKLDQLVSKGRGKRQATVVSSGSAGTCFALACYVRRVTETAAYRSGQHPPLITSTRDNLTLQLLKKCQKPRRNTSKVSKQRRTTTQHVHLFVWQHNYELAQENGNNLEIFSFQVPTYAIRKNTTITSWNFYVFFCLWPLGHVTFHNINRFLVLRDKSENWFFDLSNFKYLYVAFK